MKEITFDYLAELFPHRSPEELISYIEAHEPRTKYTEDKERLLHWHVGVSHLDPRTGNQLSAAPNIQRENAARQSMLAAKYGLDDPIDFIDFNRAPSGRKLSNRGKIVTSLANHFEDNPPQSYSEITDVISQWNQQNKVQLSIKKEGVGAQKFISLTPTDPSGKPMKTIRLKGKNFRSLEPLYAEKFDLNIDKDGYVTRSEKLQEDLKRIRSDAEFRDRFLEASKRTMTKNNPNREFSSVDGELTESAKKWRANDFYIKEVEQHLSELSNTQRAFFRLYSVSLRANVLGDAKCFTDKQTKHKVVWQPDHKLRLVDSGERITTANLTTDAKRLAAVHMMLEMGAAKGWDLSEITFNGDDEFIKCAEAERDKRVAELREGKKVVRSIPDHVTGKQVIIKTTPVSPLTRKMTLPPKAQDKISLSKKQIERLKRDVDQGLVIKLLREKDVSVGHVTSNKKRHTLFLVGGKKFNSIDALTKLGGYDLKDAIKALTDGTETPDLSNKAKPVNTPKNHQRIKR